MQNMSADAIWKKMLAGNRRYAAGLPPQADISAHRRSDTAASQHPCAAVVACSDSRVPVEYVFDMGIGDLFVVRVAGNVIGAHEAGCLEYAMEHLHVKFVLILGHTDCGAVTAALSGSVPRGLIGSIIEKIAPAVDRVREQNPAQSGAALTRAVCIENVHQAIINLFDLSPAVETAAARGTITVVGALYDIETGDVSTLKL